MSAHSCHHGAVNHKNQADVILHAFDWPYQKVADHAQQIALLGYHSVLISPPMKSPDDQQWWMRYQPQDYRVIDNPLGNKTDFVAMLQALTLAGIKLYVDVVFNHMANEAHLRSDLNYPNADIMQQYQQQADYFREQTLFGDLSHPLFTEADFEAAFAITDWLDAKQVQTGRLTGGEGDPGLPTLAPTPHVIAQQRAYLQALKQLGVQGFRIDAAKHMQSQHLQQVWSDDICQDVKVFAEIITGGGQGHPEYETFLAPFIQHPQFKAYDFPLFHTLLNVFKHGSGMQQLLNMEQQGQCLAAQQAITFAVTHDIPNNGIFRSQMMTPEQELLVYSYLLGCSDGTPLIYTDLNPSQDFNTLGQARWQHSWYNASLINMIHFHRQVHGEPSSLLYCDDIALVIARGDGQVPKGIVAINKGQTELTIAIPNGHYQVIVGGDDLLQQDSQQLYLIVPANSSVMLLCQ